MACIDAGLLVDTTPSELSVSRQEVREAVYTACAWLATDWTLHLLDECVYVLDLCAP